MAETSNILRVAAIGHRVISFNTHAAVARSVHHLLAAIGRGAARPEGLELAVISPLAQGADQLIAAAGLEEGYRLQAVLPAAQADYEKTFNLGDFDAEIAAFRALLDKARQGLGAEELPGDLSHEDSRNRAYLACADTVIRRADIVLAILSADRWESQTGQSARDAVALGTPLVVIDPALPGQPLLHRKDGIVPATDEAIAATMTALLDKRFPNDIARAKAALAAGDFLTAVDLLRHAPDDPDLKRRIERDYLLVLALARAGAARLGLENFHQRLSRAPLELLPADTARDIAALEARCLKDIALEAHADVRRAALIEAADAYETVYRRHGGYYPLINAATLFLLAGDQATAENLARQTLREVADSKDYWGLATKAEALLVLGKSDEAGPVLKAASALGVSASAMASTKKQLLAVCAARGSAACLLDDLKVPSVVYYCGHRNLDDADAARLQIAGQMARLNAGFAYGSLCSGGDILMAEAALAAGIELHVVLPYRADEFVRSSVAPGWEDRFAACMNKARTVSYVIDNDVLQHDCVKALCSSHAMGMARRHADALATTVCQLAIWNGQPAKAVATAAAEVAKWSGLGLASVIIPPSGEAYRLTQAPSPPPDHISPDVVPRAFLFADVRGFSKLPERHMELFVQTYMAGLAQAIEPFGGDIDYRATAGDGIFLVFRTPALAAACAIAMQERSESFDLDHHGIDVHLQLRIAVHYGPCHPIHDPILKKDSFAGREIIRAARIEPVTPPGEIYVTEQLASALFLAGAKDWRCDYVGIQPTAKGFGNFRMYSIKPHG
ncbi:MAG: tetratricopeptide repeat-containing protein [Alphaproteobacteria bacterium]